MSEELTPIHTSVVVPTRTPLIAHPVLVFRFRFFESKPATIAGRDGEAIGWIRRPRRSRWTSPSGLGFFELNGAPAWWIRPLGNRARDPDAVLLPDGRVLGEILSEDLQIGGVVRAHLQRQHAHGSRQAGWKVVADSGMVAAIGRVTWKRNGDPWPRELWRVQLDDHLQGPLRYLAAAAAYTCQSLYTAERGE